MFDWSDCIRLINKAQRVAVLPHLSADGDGLGSAFSLAMAIDSLGKKAVVLLEEPVEGRLEFMLPLNKVEYYILPEKPEGDFDLAIAVDAADRRTSTIDIKGTRGRILDRNGVVLAYSKNSYNVEFLRDADNRTDYDSAACFNDDGRPVHAIWTTPEILGVNFYFKKRFRRVSVMLGAAVRTGIRIQAVYDGVKELLTDYTPDGRYFAWSQLQWSKFTWKTDTSSQIFTEKISLKPDNRKAQFVFENDILNEPASLYAATIEFTEQR